jgi:7-carboxy-7-deazaguanine synthase
MAVRLVPRALAGSDLCARVGDAEDLGGIPRVSDIRISEIFGPTIQGEGPLIGTPTVFVRTAGCDYRCTWCDTLYAVLPEHRDEWTFMSAAEVLREVNRLSSGKPILVTLSGGNPALQPLAELIREGRGEGHRFAMETQGSIAQPWFADLESLVISPKPPSSGMTVDWSALRACVEAAGEGQSVALKIVVFDDVDFDFARDVASRFPQLPVYLQPGNPVHQTELHTPALLGRLSWLVDKVREAQWHDARVLPQLHVLVWGDKRGV